MKIMMYRLFINDIAPHRYSGLTDITAKSQQAALVQAQKWKQPGVKTLCIPHSSKNLWPDSRTGAVLPSTESMYLV